MTFSFRALPMKATISRSSFQVRAVDTHERIASISTDILFQAEHANLLAAAPDMLAALREFASLMERAGALHPSRDLREVIGDPAGLAIRTRAAIAKATAQPVTEAA